MLVIAAAIGGSYLHECFLGLKPKAIHSAAFVALCAIAQLLGVYYAASRSPAAAICLALLFWPLTAAAYKRDYYMDWGCAFACPLPSIINLLAGTVIAGFFAGPY